MSINYAILGILSSKPQTGYDIKKIIQDSPFMPWSGNNNQIYKVLLGLLDKGYVTNEVLYQEDSPSKKIYTITEEGLEELKTWVLSESELPELKKMFLVQLAWCEHLSDEEVDLLLTNYENSINMQLLMQKESNRREQFSPKRSLREEAVWDSIYKNIIMTYENELSWTQKTREALSKFYTHTKSTANLDKKAGSSAQSIK